MATFINGKEYFTDEVKTTGGAEFGGAVTLADQSNPISIGSETAFAPVVIVKAADQTVNNSTTLVNISSFKLAVGANEKWLIRVVFYSNSNDTADFKGDFTVPTGAQFRYIAWGQDNAATVSALIKAAGDTFLAIGVGANRVVHICEGLLEVSTTAGDFQPQFAQNTADASDTKVLTNTHMICYRLA